ncbi:25551_t:CDS:1 [Dentiscutata erythropus]|uniref:25551_t:CDS:1 n=1 Tax=Dentiscutata erythropus TaxID=1348616 RepID=A0A9N9K7H6_9GLOM|nr:25551_t:CDS:1 [Dentiscutata erythropus]
MPFYIYFISRQNIQNTRYLGIFANENVVNEWYNAVKELQRLNPAQEKFAIEKVDSNWYTLPHSDHIIQLIYNVHEKELTSFKGKCFFLLLGDVNGFGGRNMPLINNGGGGSGSGGGGNSIGNPNNPGSNSGSENTSGNPGSNTGQGGNNLTGGNTTGPNTGTGNIGGSENSTGSNPNESGANKPNNSGSGLNQKQKLALDEIFKNLQMQRTDNDDNDLEELRKVSQRLAELLNMQNVNKK